MHSLKNYPKDMLCYGNFYKLEGKNEKAFFQVEEN